MSLTDLENYAFHNIHIYCDAIYISKCLSRKRMEDVSVCLIYLWNLKVEKHEEKSIFLFHNPKRLCSFHVFFSYLKATENFLPKNLLSMYTKRELPFFRA